MFPPIKVREKDNRDERRDKKSRERDNIAPRELGKGKKKKNIREVKRILESTQVE